MQLLACLLDRCFIAGRAPSLKRLDAVAFKSRAIDSRIRCIASQPDLAFEGVYADPDNVANIQLMLAFGQRSRQLGADKGNGPTVTGGSQPHRYLTGGGGYLAGQFFNHMTAGEDIAIAADPGFMH